MSLLSSQILSKMATATRLSLGTRAVPQYVHGRFLPSKIKFAYVNGYAFVRAQNLSFLANKKFGDQIA